MIGFFTDPKDHTVVDLVRRSAQIAAPQTELRVLELEERPDSRAMEAREFAREIMDMDACIIDLDRRSIVHYAAELGSLAAGINYWAGHGREDYEAISSLDSRILLITRKPLAKSEGNRYFGEYYTMMSLAEGTPAEQVQTLAQWLSDTVGRAHARVFVSYRSTQQSFARKVAKSLRRRGAAVWFDEMNIRPGESIPGAISNGLGWCTHMVMCVDETFFDSEWTKAEYESVLHRYMTEGHYFRGYQRVGVLIPLFLVDPSAEALPPMLRRIRGIDCRGVSFQKSMNQLWMAISAVGQR